MTDNTIYKSVKDLPDRISVVLASQSPRRKDFLTKMGFQFTIHPADCDESMDPSIPPVDAVRLLATRKAKAVENEIGKDSLIIASDTLVALKNKPLGKPLDEQDAIHMLKSLSGKEHVVYTGLCLSYHGMHISAVDATRVKFRNLSEEEINEYVATGEPMDKAGAYGIQGLGGKLVDSYIGELDTIIGFPCKLCDALLMQLEERGLFA